MTLTRTRFPASALPFIAVVDDYTIARDGLAQLLRSHPGLDIVGSAGDGEALPGRIGTFPQRGCTNLEAESGVLPDAIRLPHSYGLYIGSEFGTESPPGRWLR